MSAEERHVGDAKNDPSGPAASPADGFTEILARFARRASADAPSGTIQLEGHEPVAFAGWLDLMARVEELLGEEGDGRVP
jgi:hypothetical protein